MVIVVVVCGICVCGWDFDGVFFYLRCLGFSLITCVL